MGKKVLFCSGINDFNMIFLYRILFPSRGKEIFRNLSVIKHKAIPCYNTRVTEYSLLFKNKLFLSKLFTPSIPCSRRTRVETKTTLVYINKKTVDNRGGSLL